jgi:FkbM family methyltransferase
MNFLQNLRKKLPHKFKKYIRYGVRLPQISNLIAPYVPSSICIDVGASYYPHTKWYIFLNSPLTYWLAVEPNKKNVDYANKWEWDCQFLSIHKGLSQDGGLKTLHITNIDSGSSLLPPVIPPAMKHREINLDYLYPVTKCEIETITLTHAISSLPLDLPLFVKLDTQGTELSILKGSEQLFFNNQILGIEMESTMLAQPIMENSGKFWEACSYLESKGFELLHIKPIYSPIKKRLLLRKHNTLINECDAVFSLRWDIASKMSVEFRVALLAFYITNLLYVEAKSVLQVDKDLTDFLKHRGCNVNKLLTLLETN